MKNDVLGENEIRNEAGIELGLNKVDRESLVGIELRDGLDIDGKGSSIELVAGKMKYSNAKLKNVKVLTLVAPHSKEVHIDNLILENISTVKIDKRISINKLSLKKVKDISMNFNKIEKLFVVESNTMMSNEFSSLNTIEIESAEFNELILSTTNFPSLAKISLKDVRTKKLVVAGNIERLVELSCDSFNNVDSLKLYNVMLLDKDSNLTTLEGSFSFLFLNMVYVKNIHLNNSTIGMLNSLNVKELVQIENSTIKGGISFMDKVPLEKIILKDIKFTFPEKDEDFGEVDVDFVNIDLLNLKNLKEVHINKCNITGIKIKGREDSYVKLNLYDTPLRMMHTNHTVYLENVVVGGDLDIIYNNTKSQIGGISLSNIKGVKALRVLSEGSKLSAIKLDISQSKETINSIVLKNILPLSNEFIIDDSFSMLNYVSLDNVDFHYIEIVGRKRSITLSNMNELVGLKVEGAVIKNELYFDSIENNKELYFKDCLSHYSITVKNSSFPSIVIQNSSFSSLHLQDSFLGEITIRDSSFGNVVFNRLRADEISVLGIKIHALIPSRNVLPSIFEIGNIESERLEIGGIGQNINLDIKGGLKVSYIILNNVVLESGLNLLTKKMSKISLGKIITKGDFKIVRLQDTKDRGVIEFSSKSIEFEKPGKLFLESIVFKKDQELAILGKATHISIEPSSLKSENVKVKVEELDEVKELNLSMAILDRIEIGNDSKMTSMVLHKCSIKKLYIHKRINVELYQCKIDEIDIYKAIVMDKLSIVNSKKVIISSVVGLSKLEINNKGIKDSKPTAKLNVRLKALTLVNVKLDMLSDIVVEKGKVALKDVIVDGKITLNNCKVKYEDVENAEKVVLVNSYIEGNGKDLLRVRKDLLSNIKKIIKSIK